jgi:hypothetical protein
LSAQARAAEILFLRLTDVDRAQLLPDGAACATFGGVRRSSWTVRCCASSGRWSRPNRPGVVVPVRALMPGPDVLRAIADHDPAVEQLVEPAAPDDRRPHGVPLVPVAVRGRRRRLRRPAGTTSTARHAAGLP